MSNGNIKSVENREDGSMVIHTTYGMKNALHRMLIRSVSEIVNASTEQLLESYQAGQSCLADMTAALVKIKVMTSSCEDLKGMDFILTNKDHHPTISFASYVPNDDKVQAIEWLIQELQTAEAVDMLGEQISAFVCAFSDDVKITVGVGDTFLEIQRRWCTATTPCSSR